LLELDIVFNDLPDPPFITGGWATAEFTVCGLHYSQDRSSNLLQQPPDTVLNGTLAVNTTGIQTRANCNIPASESLFTTDSARYVINATSVDGCAASASFNPDTADQQYGIVTVPNCGQSSSSNITFNPVMFWFFRFKDNDEPQSRSVFCNPTISLFDIVATLYLNNGSLANVTIIGPYDKANNVTGAPLSGRAYNAYGRKPPLIP
jgi:hypothetical protein